MKPACQGHKDKNIEDECLSIMEMSSIFESVEDADENDSVCNNQYRGPDKRRRTKTKITGYLAIKITVDWEFMNSMGRFFECCTLLAIGNLHGGQCARSSVHLKL